jgi:phosphoribosylglycinamide formyltransferase-1
MKRIVILISGRGSNMEAIVQRCAAEGWPARVAAVVSNRADAKGLEFAAAQGIATAVVDHRAFASREAFDDALAQTIDAFTADVVVLAGFMRILDGGFVRRWAGRLLNIHPSLLPAYRGLHTHRRVLEAGERPHGCTVHYVVEELDAGPVIIQGRLAVRPGEDETALSARVQRLEHSIYARAGGWIADGGVAWRGGTPFMDDEPLTPALVEEEA